MGIDNIYHKPSQKVLEEILSGKSLNIASPFYSASSVALLNIEDAEKISFITRLPDQYNMPVAFIENDPTPLQKILKQPGNKFSLYALPSLHAKLFMNENSVWMGSSNFTLNGFSGKQEIIAQFSGEQDRWSSIFDSYVRDATRVTQADLEKLIHWIQRGLTRINRVPVPEDGDDGRIREVPFSFEDFVSWLQEDSAPLPDLRDYLFVRVNGKNFMSGHVRAGFNGAMAFLVANENHMKTLEAVNADKIPTLILNDFSAFVRKFGDEYKGPRGGKWRNYLSTRLGGVQTNGGAGDIIVKRCLHLIPLYAEDRR